MHLPAILDQDYPNFEVIIVDDGSKDGTYEYLKSLSQNNPKMLVLNIPPLEKKGKGKKYALWKGINAAKNDSIVLTDADCEPVTNQWLRELAVTFLEGKKIGLGYGGYFQKNTFLNTIIQFETLTTFIQYVTLALHGKPYMGVGRNLTYSKSLFEKKGGIEKIYDITSGDDDLVVGNMVNAQNTKVLTSLKSITLSHPSSNFKDYYLQKNRHYSVGTRYKLDIQILLGMLALSWMTIHGLLLFQLIFGDHSTICLVFYVIRTLLCTFSIKYIARHFEIKMPIWVVVILDWCWWIYLMIFSLSLFRRNVEKW